MNRNELDEMQVQRRNKIGNQSFLMLFYFLMIGMGLEGLGMKWLQYPMNVWVIMMVSMTLYLVRCIGSHAYVAPGNPRKPLSKNLLIGTVAGVVGGIAIIFLPRIGDLDLGGEGGAMTLFIFSVVAMIIVAAVAYISYRQNRDTGE